MISLNKTHSLLVAAGAVLGVVVPKVLASEPAHKLAVNTVAAGMRVKSGYQDIVEQAKAQADDIVSEAEYLNTSVETQVVDGGKAE
jgi:hypothetical protein